MNQELINNLSEMVENACKSDANIFGYGIWSHHIKPMLTIAEELSEKYHADSEIVLISTLLHDLAGILDYSKAEKHHIYGALEAESILVNLHYPINRIELIKRCILNHRGSVNNEKETIEEICIADADAISHIVEISSLFYAAYTKINMEIDEGSKWIKDKLNRDWLKMSERAKELYKEKYETILSILK